MAELVFGLLLLKRFGGKKSTITEQSNHELSELSAGARARVRYLGYAVALDSLCSCFFSSLFLSPKHLSAIQAIKCWGSN